MLTRLLMAFWVMLIVVLLAAINGCMTQQDLRMEKEWRNVQRHINES